MQNPFKKIMDMDVFKAKPSSVLGIDIGLSAIKVVQLKKKGGQAILETYGELALGPYAGVEIGRATNLPPEKIAAALTDLLKESNTTTKQCGVAIPIGSSLVKLIELPPVEKSQIAALVPLEARKYIPVPITEVSLDWWALPRHEVDEEAGGEAKQEKTEVLIVAIHNEVLTRYQDLIKATGLDSSFIEIEIFSTIRAVLGQDLSTVMIFDMGAGSTKLYIVEGGIVRNSHTINRGSQDITVALSASLGVSMADAENLKRSYMGGTRDVDTKIRDTIALNLDFLFSETNQVLLNYQRRYNKNISKVVLTGGGVGVKGFLELARMNLQTEVIAGDPFGKVQFPAFLEEVLKTTGPEFSVAVGVALRRLQEID